MDDLDRRLIKALQLDGRAPVASLARRLDVPRSTVQERLNRLSDDGVIRRFVPVLDHAKLGRPVTAHILASFMQGPGVSQRQVAQRLADIPGVHEVHLISGEWDILLKVHAESIEAIGDLVIDRIRDVPGIARTVTMTSFHVQTEEPVG
jgi:DNA-binding Lrp family transcriptional regulator